MKLLNLGCGMVRPGDPFINVDNMRTYLREGTPERRDLDAIPNYVEHDISDPLPFDDLSVDGCLLNHVLEHFPTQTGMKLLKECYRVMLPGASLLVSVPDASYFRDVDAEDRNENWPRLFGQTDPRNPIPTFRSAALFFNEHAAVLTEDAVWCMLREAGFQAGHIRRIRGLPPADTEAMGLLTVQLNRRIFSCEMIAVK